MICWEKKWRSTVSGAAVCGGGNGGEDALWMRGLLVSGRESWGMRAEEEDSSHVMRGAVCEEVGWLERSDGDWESV